MLEILRTMKKHKRETSVIKCVVMYPEEQHVQEEEYRFV
jgi:hypothetical protein